MSQRSKRGARLRLHAVGKRFEQRQVLQDLNLSVRPGEFVAIVGRSGSGKSTLLRLLCDLEQPSEGAVAITGDDGAELRDAVRVVFQEPRLLPWRSLLDNVRLGKAQLDPERALGVLGQVGLADRAYEFPGVLSGGQRQRVALARALLHQPRVLLLDEPFGALDALTRFEAQQLVEELWLEAGFTAIMVTHDVTEAVLLSDRVLVLEDGRIVEDVLIDVQRPRARELPELAQLSAALLERVLGHESRHTSSIEPKATNVYVRET